MLYYAYGSNLCLPRLRDRVTKVSLVAVGELKGWQLVFNKHGRDNSAKANIEQTNEPSESVCGALLEIPAENWDGLRRAERFPEHYSEVLVPVSTNEGLLSAVTYVGCAAFLSDDLLPFDWYLEHIVRGGTELGLPFSYLNGIARTKTISDPDMERAAREASYWLE